MHLGLFLNGLPLADTSPIIHRWRSQDRFMIVISDTMKKGAQILYSLCRLVVILCWTIATVPVSYSPRVAFNLHSQEIPSSYRAYGETERNEANIHLHSE